MKRLLAALLCWLALALTAPAIAAIGTPTALGTASSTTCGTNFSITTGADAPAGSTVVLVIVNTTATADAFTITDGAGNSYAAVVSANGTGRTLAIFTANGIGHLANGGTITIHDSQNSTCAVSAYDVTGLAGASPVDQTATSTTASTTPSLSVTDANANDILFGADSRGSALSYSTPATGFTTLTSATATSLTAVWAYQIVSTTGSKTYAPTLSLAGDTHLLVSLKAAIAGRGRLTTLGAG